MPVIPGEPMARHLARVAAEAAAELHMRIQDPGDYPVPLSRQWEVISSIGQATGELAASLRAIAPMTRHQAVQRWLDNAIWKIGDAHLEIGLAWRQLAPRDQRDRPRPETAQPAAALAAADFPEQPGGVPLAAGSSPSPPAKTAGQRDARRSPRARKA